MTSFKDPVSYLSCHQIIGLIVICIQLEEDEKHGRAAMEDFIGQV